VGEGNDQGLARERRDHHSESRLRRRKLRRQVSGYLSSLNILRCGQIRECGSLLHGDDNEGEVVLEGAAAEGGDLFAGGGEGVGRSETKSQKLEIAKEEEKIPILSGEGRKG
jgi:hypothetical protein